LPPDVMAGAPHVAQRSPGADPVPAWQSLPALTAPRLPLLRPPLLLQLRDLMVWQEPPFSNLA
jgi:hypothetical protein